MNNGMTGYNEQEVIEATNGIKAGIENYFGATNTRLENDFVRPMENLWASEDARSYFESYEDAVRAQFQSDLESLNTIIEHFNSAAAKYASESGASYSPINYDAPACDCDISGIKTDIAGTRGINRTEAIETAQVLNAIKEEAVGALESIKSSASASGFYGEAMAHQEAIDNSIENMKNRISNLIDEMYSRVDQAIQATADKYGNLEAEAAAAAAGN